MDWNLNPFARAWKAKNEAKAEARTKQDLQEIAALETELNKEEEWTKQ